MKLTDIKTALQSAQNVTFQLPDGSYVPAHFHVTEVGFMKKHFIDCGGTIRSEAKAVFQLWEAGDTHHRLVPEKLLRIISLSETTLGLDRNLDVEVEYQGSTIGRYGLEFDGKDFLLTATQTACLASDACGIPQEAKSSENLSDLQPKAACCTPGGGCC